jgi:heat shock protein HslJ
MGPGSPVTLRFADDHSLSGAAPCNSYSGGFVLNGSSMKIGPLAQTLRACEADVMDAEQAYLSALEAVTTVRASHDRLELIGGSGIHLVYTR